MKKVLLTALAVIAATGCGLHESNIALMKTAYASSNYDFNLTAQLVTDGLVFNGPPAWLSMEVDGVPIPAAKQVPLLDMDTYSRMDFSGGIHEITLGFHNYNPSFEIAHFVAVLDEKAPWKIRLEACNDAGSWVLLDEKCGDGITVNESFDAPDLYNYYRFIYSSPEDCGWSVRSIDFHDKDDVLEPTGNKHELYSSCNLNDISPASVFRSVWMSAAGGSQWLVIDLGKKCLISEVDVVWALSPSTFTLSCSDDTESWADVRPGRPFRSRYVRLNLSGNPVDRPYMLSEVKIMGSCKNGTFYGSSGSEGWQLRRDDWDSPWIPAKVPGTVLSSYLDLGALPDPNYADNQLQISESYFRSDFRYRKVLDGFSPTHEGKRLLVFDGVNWKADVFLNSECLGSIDGAFTRASFDITGKLRGNCSDTLEVLVKKPAHPGFATLQNLDSPGMNGGKPGADNPCFHASVGWDWIPTIRGRNIGIWNDVRIEDNGGVRVVDPCVRTTLNLPDTTEAVVRVSAVLANMTDSPSAGILSCTLCGAMVELPIGLDALETKEVELPLVRLENPELWWPEGYGNHILHDVELKYCFDDGALSDQCSFKAGLRQMDYRVEDGALQMYINGRRFIGKGGNWGFSESNLRYSAAEYDAAVRYHADMNFTMIRNWVGQTGDEEFFKACDRHGIMVWQDFWLANPSDGPDPYYEDMFMANARDFVAKIRRHPCIALYCGRNEGYPPKSLDAGLKALVSDMHDDILYIPDSADDCVSGRGPYNVLPSGEYFNLPFQDKFHSERGMPSVMNIENLEKTLGKDHLWPVDDMWGIHDFTMGGAQKCSSFVDLVEKAFGPCDNALQFTRRAQWINYDGYRALFESRSAGRNGLLLWMSHPAWPSLVWQTYDWFFEPLASYFGCKKACEPLHIQYNAARGMVEIVNASAGGPVCLKAVVELAGLEKDGIVPGTSRSVEMRTVSEEDTTADLFDISSLMSGCSVDLLKLKLIEEGVVRSENFYIIGREEGDLRVVSELPAVSVGKDVSVSEDGDVHRAHVHLTNNSETVPALRVRVCVKDSRGLVTPVIYSDNYISLMPHESKEVIAEFAPENGRYYIEISGLNVK